MTSLKHFIKLEWMQKGVVSIPFSAGRFQVPTLTYFLVFTLLLYDK